MESGRRSLIILLPKSHTQTDLSSQTSWVLRRAEYQKSEDIHLEDPDVTQLNNWA